MPIFSRAPKRNIRILAVDDDPLQLRVLSAYLAEGGLADVTLAASADEALRQIHETLEPFDIFLLDIQMPGMDGITLCRRILGISDYSDSVVIMISSLSDRDHIRSAFAAGAVDYVTKPFEALELTTRIKVACGLSQARTEASETELQLSSYIAQSTESGYFSAAEPVSILGVPSVVDHVMLCNFVLQLSFGQTLSAHAFALGIDDFEDLTEQCSPAEVYQLLLKIAKPLSNALSGRGYLISYAGSGIFVCVSHTPDWMTTEDIADIIHIDLEELDIINASGTSRPVEISVGPRVSNHLHTLDRRVGLIHRAIAGVEPATPAGPFSHRKRAQG